MKFKYRADQVGSFLRPQELLDARNDPNVPPGRLRELEEENRRLKHMYANLSLEHEVLKDIIEKKLDTPERFAVFFEQFFEYEYDNGDYWQSAEETVKRIDKESGKMEGDCDDWAFFGRDVKRRQGENAHVLLIPHHAICVWVREVQTKEGTRYHAYSIGTFGYD